ncbi:MAG: WbqC family protein [Bacteroidetes bacterium]|nr:WbqC family protein [Bacteroidota bacterium]
MKNIINKIAAIHQPDFFPWLGNFDKINRADVFIVLDNVQYIKKGSNWSNRVQIIINGEPRFITIPVERNYHGTRSYIDTKLCCTTHWREKMLSSIKSNYGKSPFFQETYSVVEKLIMNPTDSLLAYNLKIIFTLTEKLNIDSSKIILATDLNPKGKATEQLINLTKAADCNTYMCGGGADGYQLDSRFEEEGIDLLYQNFKHPVYKQFNTVKFYPGLSIIDALMNCGFSETENLIKVNSGKLPGK